MSRVEGELGSDGANGWMNVKLKYKKIAAFTSTYLQKKARLSCRMWSTVASKEERVEHIMTQYSQTHF